MFRLALLQYPIIWADRSANLRLTEERIRALAGQADMALLPEMFTTGFCTDHPELAEPSDGETIQRLQRLSDETDIAIVSSFIAEQEGKLFNRGFFVLPHHAPVFVDKAHLYKHGGEDRFFTAGNQRTIVTFRGVKFRLLLCYDLRFPVWARQEQNDLYDILLVSANWPQIRIPYWDVLLPARGTENQCFVAGVNPVGDDALGLHYNGHSIAYDTHLKPLAAFANDEQGTRIACFDIEALHHFRQVSPLWQDADTYILRECNGGRTGVEA